MTICKFPTAIKVPRKPKQLILRCFLFTSNTEGGVNLTGLERLHPLWLQNNLRVLSTLQRQVWALKADGYHLQPDL